MSSLFSRICSSLKRRRARSDSDHFIRALARQVSRNAQPSNGQPRPDQGQPVLIFNSSTRLSGLSLNAAYSLLTHWSLRLHGARVIQVVCRSGLSPCVLGTDRYDPGAEPPCAHCVQQSQTLFAGADVRWLAYRPDKVLQERLIYLDLADLVQFKYEGLPLGALVLPSLRWILRRHHLEADAITLMLYRQYILSAWSTAQQFEALIADLQPQAVVVFNGMFYPEATARHIARQHGLRVIAHEVGMQPFSAFFTTGDATAYPIDIPESFELTPEQDAHLDQYLEQRFQGNFTMAGVRFWPEMQSLSPDFWQRASQFRQIVPVFTNVIFDTSQGHANVVFEHMFAWLDLVLEVVKAHPETFFVVRAHPDEARPGKKSMESVAGWVRSSGADRLPNVLFVNSTEYFSSYELIQRSKFVMVYNSTIGLEAALLEAAVLCGGRARFTQLPTVFFPPTPEAYRQAAEDFLAAEKIAIPVEFRRNARRFLHYQLFRTSLPFGDFLRDDGFWQGYVAIKPIEWTALLPKNSKTLNTIVRGILHDTPFLLEE
ncbi:MAG TPA: hypothetical protein VLH85_06710 [Levilinea sp.]|nr:hypothetical protein [Levilinea sp.]